MKTYTDIEQSKRLAEFLPLDSADMSYANEFAGTMPYNEIIKSDNPIFKAVHKLPCWSLAALFDALPKNIDQYFKTMGYFDNFYHCDYLDEDGESVGFGTSADTLIDACVDMIVLLHGKSILSY